MISNYKVLNQRLNEVNKLINNKEYEKAENILLNYIKDASNLYNLDDNNNDYSFKNITEFYLYIHIFKINKNVRMINLVCDKAYQQLGYIKVEEKKYDEALKYLKEGLKYNPISLDILFEIVEVYKMQGNLDKMKKSIDGLYEYIYSPSDLARYYRNLGFYYIETKNYELAFSLYVISLEFEYNNFALSEMLYIRKVLNSKDYIILKSDAVKILIKNNINVGISDRNIKLLDSLSKNEVLYKNKEFINKLNSDINILKHEIK